MNPSLTATECPSARDQRQILDYVVEMSRELSQLAETAGLASLAGDLRRCSEKASTGQART